MLQSSIYPENYRVGQQYFFIVKIQIEGLSDLQETIELRKFQIDIHDQTRNRSTGELENNIIKIERDLHLKDEEDEEVKNFAVIKPNGGYHEHNVLLYIENFGTKVTGTLEYLTEKDKKEGTTSTIEIGEFYLDLQKGQKLVKNHTFTDFWKAAEEYEQQRADGDNTLDMQDQFER